MALANVESDGSLTYTSLSGASPVVTTLFDAMTPDMGVEGFEFNREGSRVATYGWKDRAKPDTFFAQLLPTPGTLSTPYASLPATVSSVNIGWSPDGQWLLYETSDSADDTEQWFGVNVAGATPGTPIPFPVASLSSVHWLPDGHRFIADKHDRAVVGPGVDQRHQAEFARDDLGLSNIGRAPLGGSHALARGSGRHHFDQLDEYRWQLGLVA
jgi:hypothetical protein